MYANLVFEELADAPLGCWRAYVTELVQRGLELESTSHETGGKATRQVVLLQEEHRRALCRQLCGRAQPTVPSTDDDAIVRFL